MKIAIVSDAHDHKENLNLVIAQIEKLEAEALLFCGDFCAPPMAIALCAFKKPIYVVLGNNDGDAARIYFRMKENHADVTIFMEGEGTFELSGCKIAMTHYPLYGEALAKTEEYDLIAFGHDHAARILKFGKSLAVNPGSLNLLRPDTKPSFAVYDATKHEAALYDLDGNILST